MYGSILHNQIKKTHCPERLSNMHYYCSMAVDYWEKGGSEHDTKEFALEQYAFFLSALKMLDKKLGVK